MKEELYDIANNSTCSRRKVGCLIYCEGKTIGTGYNKVIDKSKCCHRHESGKDLDNCGAIHAEVMAILSINKYLLSLSELWVTTFPCPNCVKIIIESGIKKVVYFEDYSGMEDSLKLLRENNVVVLKYIE